MFSRALSGYLREVSARFPALVLTGARQTGKTTLLRETFADHGYVSLDLPSTAAQAEDDPDQFFARNQPPLIIDEVQYAPALFRHLKKRIDEDRHRMGAWILTGSQKFVLMQHLSESLAGRAAILELEGMSWNEVSGAGLTSAPLDLMLRGGFPELWRLPELPRERFFESYVVTYLERDVRQILKVGSLRDFDRFIRLLATRNAQQLDMTAVGDAVGVSTKTAGAWISVLESSGQITLLEPWFGNVGKRIVKTPKVYFNDTGVLCWMLGLSAENLAGGPFLGPIWETLVFAELRKSLAHEGSGRKIYFYRDNSGLEVDFLVPGGDFLAIEGKSKPTPTSDDIANLQRFARIARASGEPLLQSLRLVCISRTTEPYTLAARAESELPVAVGGIGEVGESLRAPK